MDDKANFYISSWNLEQLIFLNKRHWLDGYKNNSLCPILQNNHSFLSSVEPSKLSLISARVDERFSLEWSGIFWVLCLAVNHPCWRRNAFAPLRFVIPWAARAEVSHAFLFFSIINAENCVNMARPLV